jgi:hypothetical protein
LLALTGPGLRLQKLHQCFFYLWLIIVIIHVVHYLPKLPELLASHPAERAQQAATGSRARWLLLVGSIIVGLALALLTYHLRTRWGSWEAASSNRIKGTATRRPHGPGKVTAASGLKPHGALAALPDYFGPQLQALVGDRILPGA